MPLDLSNYRSIEPPQAPVTDDNDDAVSVRSAPMDLEESLPKDRVRVDENGNSFVRTNTVSEPVWVQIRPMKDMKELCEYLDSVLPQEFDKGSNRTLYNRRSQDRTFVRRLLKETLPEDSGTVHFAPPEPVSKEKKAIIDDVIRLSHASGSSSIPEREVLANKTLKDLSTERIELAKKTSAALSTGAGVLTAISILGAAVAETAAPSLEKNYGFTTRGLRQEYLDEKEELNAAWEQVLAENPIVARIANPSLMITALHVVPLLKINSNQIVESSASFLSQQQPPEQSSVSKTASS